LLCYAQSRSEGPHDGLKLSFAFPEIMQKTSGMGQAFRPEP